MASSSRSEKLRKLRSFRHGAGEDHDYDYIHTFNTIHKENNRMTENKFPYEDGHDFEGFPPVDFPSNLDFEGFEENEDFHLKEYTAEFWNMLENLKQEVDFDLECNNEDNGVEDNMDNLSDDGLILTLLEILPKPLEDDDVHKAVEREDV